MLKIKYTCRRNAKLCKYTWRILRQINIFPGSFLTVFWGNLKNKEP